MVAKTILFQVGAIAVHSVFLASSFVGFDVASGTRVDHVCHFSDEQSLLTSSLWYTLPQLFLNEEIASIVLTFQSLGQFVNICGCLSNSTKPPLHCLSLTKYKIAPIIHDLILSDEKSKKSSPQVFELRKLLKDRLAFPLLMDLCDKAGLTLPACLMHLPTELKLKIMEFLPARHIAKLGCVCLEMRSLAHSDDLWKQHFVEEFGDGHRCESCGRPDAPDSQWIGKWKRRFALHAVWKPNLFLTIGRYRYCKCHIIQAEPSTSYASGLDRYRNPIFYNPQPPLLQQSPKRSYEDVVATYFLRRVLQGELGGGSPCPWKVGTIVVHAVLLESDFVGFDVVSGTRVDHLFRFPNEKSSFTLSLSYTLPQLLLNSKGIDSIVLKFQSLGHFVSICGCLSKGTKSSFHSFSLNKYEIAPIIDGLILSDEKWSAQVFEVWKVLKDRLAFPLLIDLCAQAGLTIPTCLMRLPTELKLKIMEFLPGRDIAKLGCVCSKMRSLAHSDNLWKQKFAENFGDGSRCVGCGRQDAPNVQWISKWKHRFALHAVRKPPPVFDSVCCEHIVVYFN